MPGARRRRHGRRPGRRVTARVVVLWVILAAVVALAVGSVVEIHAQSAPYRAMTDKGYGLLASDVIDASNQTGDHLTTLLNQAPFFPNQPWTSVAGNGARTRFQQGLDQAVTESQQQADQARAITPPGPSAADGLVAVLTTRARAVGDLRTAFDGLLGMSPLPVAGAPAPTASTVPADGVPRISLTAAEAATRAAGVAIEGADRAYAALAHRFRTGAATGTGPVHLPSSVWAPSGAALTAANLAEVPARLAPPGGAAAYAPFHQLVITAVGLEPPAVPSVVPNYAAGSGLVGTSCSDPTSVTPGTTATVLPPTTTVAAQVTVTNCGTVTEAGVPVRAVLALSDPPGTPAPPPGQSGGSAQATVTLLAGRSQSLTLGGLVVAPGHNYTLTLSLVLAPPPRGPANLAGTTQEFLLRISPAAPTTTTG